MPSFIDKNGNYGYVRSGYSMSHTHGANYATAELHKREFEAICNEIIDQKLAAAINTITEAIPQIIDEYGRTVWAQLINSLVGALETDVHSEVRIAFEGAREIFYGEKCQRYVSDTIMKALLKELNKIENITIK